ncbi:unnamed protein product [Polarella glacialis]|uniref:Uncharacterized protein n=1 Tax=Polarella glacialis TaxID=89957 RepID=A0A813GRZ6_POLGL|nr:unnamed protein product [Polarella glacialis]CAE8687742.1 unnamed protein product [Polarella glacialis]
MAPGVAVVDEATLGSCFCCPAKSPQPRKSQAPVQNQFRSSGSKPGCIDPTCADPYCEVPNFVSRSTVKCNPGCADPNCAKPRLQAVPSKPAKTSGFCCGCCGSGED